PAAWRAPTPALPRKRGRGLMRCGGGTTGASVLLLPRLRGGAGRGGASGGGAGLVCPPPGPPPQAGEGPRPWGDASPPRLVSKRRRPHLEGIAGLAGHTVSEEIPMRMDKLTSRFQQALADAQSLAVGRDHNMIEPVHLLVA